METGGDTKMKYDCERCGKKFEGKRSKSYRTRFCYGCRIRKRKVVPLLFFIFLLALFSLNRVSAFDWSNTVSYYKFDDSFQFGESETGIRNWTQTGTLNYGSNCKIGKCAKVSGNATANYLSQPEFINATYANAISFWFKFDELITEGGAIGARGLTGLTTDWFFGINSSGSFLASIGSGAVAENSSIVVNANQWHFVVATWNNTGTNVYFDNNLHKVFPTNIPVVTNATDFIFRQYILDTQNKNLTLDEMGVFNRTLNSSDINELWNGGFGLPYLNPGGIVLLTPTNGSRIISPSFSAIHLTSQPINSSNATIRVYYLNHTLLYQNLLSNLTSSNAVYNFTVSNLSLPNNYLWNATGCDTNNLCVNSETSYFSFGFVENEVIFNSSTYETASESFTLNITLSNPSTLSSANFFYDGVNKGVSTKTTSGNDTIFTSTINIPAETGTKDFYWQLNLDGMLFNSSINQQIVEELLLASCGGSVTTQVLNFTSYDEQNQTRINPFKFAGTFYYWIGEGETKSNISINNLSLSEQTICISPAGINLKIDADIEYDEAGNGTIYTKRNYYFRSATVNNQSQNIPLYLLKSDQSTSFVLDVKSKNLIPLEEAIIYIQRYYPGEGIYKTVQIARTGQDGKSVGFFETETVDYKFIIVHEGEVVLETEPQKVFPESAPFTISFIVGDVLENPWEIFDGISNLQSSLTFDEDTSIVSYAYIDTSGAISEGRLVVEQVKNIGSNVEICDVSSTLSSATLTCNVTGYEGSIVAKTYISRSPAVLDKVVTFIIDALKDAFSPYALFIYFCLIVTAAFAAIWNPTAAIAMINAISIIFYMIGLFPFGGIWILAMLGLSVYLAWELKT